MPVSLAKAGRGHCDASFLCEPAMSKSSVLIVDDDTLMRTLLRAILREEGYRVLGEAKDGESALQALSLIHI